MKETEMMATLTYVLNRISVTMYNGYRVWCNAMEQHILDTNAGKQLSLAATISNHLWCLKNEQHLEMDKNFDHQMFLSKSKGLYSYSCLHF